MQCHPRAGDRGSACAAIGLNDIAITVIWRSPRAGKFMTARSERPIRRWISWVRPEGLPLADSRRDRVWVARGSMAYSAVTQPRP
jgi:hypothetical protein